MKETEIQMPDGKFLVIRPLNPYTNQLLIRTMTGKSTIVGNVNKNTKELLVFRDRSKHEHIRTSSYGFNAWLMQNSTAIDNIRIEEEYQGHHNVYRISRAALLVGGNEMDFIGESQIFYPIKQLEMYYKL